VQRLRALSPAATPPPAAPAPQVSGEAGGPGKDSWVRFQLTVAGDTVKNARLQIFACPHTTDVATWLCTQLPGRMRKALIPGTPADWAEARGVPAAKLGRLLVVEDALRECLLHWA
jgi:hypothetical protein